HTITGNKLILKPIMARPPGTAFLGAKATTLKAQIGIGLKSSKIILDSGSDFTLMNQETYDSLEPKPKKHKGQNITLVQVTNKLTISEFVTLPLTFDTKEGPVQMTVEAYIVPKMNTPFILGT